MIAEDMSLQVRWPNFLAHRVY